jgi:hypothetical protein
MLVNWMLLAYVIWGDQDFYHSEATNQTSRHLPDLVIILNASKFSSAVNDGFKGRYRLISVRVPDIETNGCVQWLRPV